MGLFSAAADAIHQHIPFVLVTVLNGSAAGSKMMVFPEGKVMGSLGSETVDAAVRTAALAALEARKPNRQRLTVAGQSWDILLDVHLPPEQLIIVGGVHIAIPLVTFARTLGLRTIVIDARSSFATAERFHHADALIHRWPTDALQEMTLDGSTYLVTLTHDEKLDTPALLYALQQPVRYVGALGSRRTHAKRVDALRNAGLSDEQIGRIHAPIGLDLGGRSPEEIAVAIIAEIVQVRNRTRGSVEGS